MKENLTNAELETYSRQVVLAGIGYSGQLKLKNAKVCIIGMGGLGTQIAFKLVGMGVGYLRMVDRDIVSRSDLHRQYLYNVDVVGQPKVEAAFQKLNRLNPDVELDPVPESMNSSNAKALIDGVDIVLDGLDSPQTRYLVNRTCNHFKIPYVFGSAIETFGNVSTIVPGKTFCLECFMPGLKDEDLPSCGVVGVHPSVLGLVTAIQVAEAVRFLTGKDPKLLNKLLYIDLQELAFDTIDISSSQNCPVCGIKPAGPPERLTDNLFVETCAKDGMRNFIISPRERIEIDIERLDAVLKEKNLSVKSSSPFGITFEISEGVQSSFLKSGLMIVQTSPKLKNDIKDDLFATYKSVLVDGLGLSPDILPDV